MGTFVPHGYSGPPLPKSITSLLYTLVQNGFQCDATGAGKTITVLLHGTPRGYVKRYVLQRRGALGYYLDPLGLEGQRCPAQEVERLRKRFCDRYGCDQSGLIEHPLGGTNSGTSLFIIGHPDLAIRALLHDAGCGSDESSHVPIVDEQSETAGVAAPGYVNVGVNAGSHERLPLETLVQEPGKPSLPPSEVCRPPAADGSQRIPFLKDFTDRHILRYEPKTSDDGLPEIYVYTQDSDWR